MQQTRPTQIQKTGTTLEGALATMAPFPLATAFADAIGTPASWRIAVAVAAIVCILVCAATIVRLVLIPRIFASLAICLIIASAFPALGSNPFLALFLSIVFIFVHVYLFDFSRLKRLDRTLSPVNRSLERLRGSALMLPVIAGFRSLFHFSFPDGMPVILGPSVLITSCFLLEYAYQSRSKLFWALGIGGEMFVPLAIVLGYSSNISGCALIFGIVVHLLLPQNMEKNSSVLDVFFDRPARILFWSFFLLCLAGALLLMDPSATGDTTIKPIDAAFTAVSAVCVTGLVVLDTSKDFSVWGQFYILLLIQLGGLGIMTITTFVFQAVAKRRMSLHQESMMTSITDTDHHDLFSSLALILKFTFAAEGMGALVLFCAFKSSGLPWLEAIWHSIFTAVSAFCNAGFTLTSDNLIAYNSNPVVLYTVSSLIVLGGLAPATSLLIPAWISARPVPVAARLVLETTLLLLVGGTVAIMAFEWNGILSGLSIADKVHNAWFQSATLRTAGFNSVPLEQIKDPTLFTMVALMFVGGSPGGTAGGVKTTTMAILVLTFLAVIRHRDEVIVRRRRISVQTVYRAVATFLAGLVVWFLFVLCLQVTQSISARQVVFEITSALGTVGLTIGATPQLDEIGKLIVMGAMFFGRIGPVTLFMYMAARKPTEFSEYPDLKINMS